MERASPQDVMVSPIDAASAIMVASSSTQGAGVEVATVADPRISTVTVVTVILGKDTPYRVSRRVA